MSEGPDMTVVTESEGDARWGNEEIDIEERTWN
jgi:hypothetical protein